MSKNKQLPKNPRQQRLEKALRKAQMPVAVGRILIVCEGEKTEPNYFKWYQTELQRLKGRAGRIRLQTVTDVYVESARIGDDIKINGAGRNTESLVTYTLKKLEDSIIDYTEVWCVFDRDSFPAQSYHRAIQLAYQNGIKVAYTNEAFELWYSNIPTNLYNFHWSTIRIIALPRASATRAPGAIIHSRG